MLITPVNRLLISDTINFLTRIISGSIFVLQLKKGQVRIGGEWKAQAGNKPRKSEEETGRPEEKEEERKR